MGHKSPKETKTYMHLTDDEFSYTMTRFTTDIAKTNALTELLLKADLSEEKLNAIKNIIAN